MVTRVLGRLPVPLRRVALRAAFALARVWWYVRRPDTYGVKLVIVDAEGLVLFVRHTYGADVWELPGGGRRRGEPPAVTARRECAEELGIDIEAWEELGEIVDRQRATAHLTCLRARTDRPPSADPGEIADLRWAPTGDPPQPLGRLARMFLELA